MRAKGVAISVEGDAFRDCFVAMLLAMTKGESLRAKGVAISVEGDAFRDSSQLKMKDTFILRSVTYLSELAHPLNKEC